MAEERIVHTVLGIEVGESRSLDAGEAEELDARVRRVGARLAARWFVRVLLVVTPIAILTWSNARPSAPRGDPEYYTVPATLLATSLAVMLFELTAVPTPWKRHALCAATSFLPVATFVAPFDAFEPLTLGATVLWVFGFLFAFMAFIGRAVADAWLVRALVPIARATDPMLLVARGVVTMDSVPRRFRELGVVANREHEIHVLADSFAIVSIDGKPVDGFPHVPIARVHLVERVDETSVAALTDRRILERRMTDGEVEELRRIRRRAMAKAYVASVPALLGIFHLMELASHASHFGFIVGTSAGLVGFPAMLALALGVQGVAYLRFGRDLFARRVRVERLATARSTDAPIREVLWHSGRPWTAGGVPDAERLIPYD